MNLNDIDAAAIDAIPETDWQDYERWAAENGIASYADDLADLDASEWAAEQAAEVERLIATWGTAEPPF